MLRHRTLGAGSARRWYWRQALGSVTDAIGRLRPDRESVLQDAKGARMTSLLQDVRFGWRMVRRRPLVTAVSMISLVVGMSAATVVFGLLNAVLFRPLPVTDPDRLALVLEQRESGMNHNFSYADFTEFRAAQKSFVDLVAYNAPTRRSDSRGGAEIVAGELVSGSYFPTLGIRMLEGRGLSPADDEPRRIAGRRRERVAVAPAAGSAEPPAGRRCSIGRRSRSLASSRRRSSAWKWARDVKFWAPLRSKKILDPSDGPDFLSRPTASWLTLIGRLRPESTFAEGGDELDRIEAGLPRTPNARAQPEICGAIRPAGRLVPATDDGVAVDDAAGRGGTGAPGGLRECGWAAARARDGTGARTGAANRSRREPRTR